jgi:DNA-binding transcriptional LysR family regulator
MIKLFYLKCFCDAALMGSVSESARRNFVSQPAVSKAIRNLEDALGVALCHHKKQKFKLTTEGEIVFLKSKEIFSSVRQLKDALDLYQKQPKMPVHFVSTQSIGLSLFPHFLPFIKNLHPLIDLHFLFGGISQIQGWLKQGIAEFALVILSQDVAEYEQMPLYTGQFGLYKHEKETRSLETTGCYVEHKEGFMVAQYQQEAQAALPLTAELNSWELIARTLESHGGYGLLPDFLLLSKQYPHLVPASSVSFLFKRRKVILFRSNIFRITINIPFLRI